MGKLLFTALVVLLGCLGAGFFLPKWLQFMLTMAMANGLVSLGLVILMRGGVFMYPRDSKDPSKPGRLRLLYEANPIGFLMEQAGGRASTGHQPMLEVQPDSLHQRIGLVFGSKSEVERIEQYHAHPPRRESDNPLFAERSLFRD